MKEKYYKYAELLLKRGLYINKKQPLVIIAPVEAIKFIRILTVVACKLEVNDIYYDFYDEKLKTIELKYFDEESICNSRFWNKSIHDEYAKKGAAFLHLITGSNESFEDIDPEKMKIASSHSLKTRQVYREKQSNNQIDWCIASVATKDWANLIFNNNLNEVEKLWNLIFDICLINEDNPIDAWDEKIKNNHILCDKLNKLNIKELKYTNKLGTNFTVSLSKGAIWCGGSSIINGREPIVNMPTEEVFTTPNKNLTNGVVYASIPLVHQGVIIKDIFLEFEEGIVINYNASTGLEELKNIISMDSESMMLGEVALVDIKTKISESKILFYETLFDENASCHIALGRGFKECLLNGVDLTEKELEDRGYNKSKNHVDLMIGTDDLNIVAKTYDGENLTIFENGSFTI